MRLKAIGYQAAGDGCRPSLPVVSVRPSFAAGRRAGCPASAAHRAGTGREGGGCCRAAAPQACAKWRIITRTCGCTAVLVEVGAQEADHLPMLVGQHQAFLACQRPRESLRPVVEVAQVAFAVGRDLAAFDLDGVLGSRAPSSRVRQRRRRLRIVRGARRTPCTHEGHETLRPSRTGRAAQMRVRRQQVVAHDAVVRAVDAVPALHAVGEGDVRVEVLEAGMMELVAAQMTRSPAPGQGIAEVSCRCT